MAGLRLHTVTDMRERKITGLQAGLRRFWRFCQLFCAAALLAACAAIPPATPTPTLVSFAPAATYAAVHLQPTPEPTVLPTSLSTSAPAAPAPSPTPNSHTVWLSVVKSGLPYLPGIEELTLISDASSVVLPADLLRDPENWKAWPVVPEVTRRAREIYRAGLALGRNPGVFSIIGDCQSLPDTFMGVYDRDALAVSGLPVNLQETVAQFSGSFASYSPTAKSASTAGAILWPAWHEGLYGCRYNETPLDCELRRRNPSIMIINLGTHYETRNITYLRKILDQLIENGVLPILSTKADNRELDEHLNNEMALLAVEYGVPLWNFYSAVSDLPNNGVGLRAGLEAQGEIYLSSEGLARHRLTALLALDSVWRKVR